MVGVKAQLKLGIRVVHVSSGKGSDAVRQALLSEFSPFARSREVQVGGSRKLLHFRAPGSWWE